jgi:DNA-directed RNA polymerase subunit RPC12/RpoP
MTIVSDPDAEETESLPYLDSETSPALSTTPRRIAFACGDCETPLAELAEGLRPQFAIVCPDCGSFNAFPESRVE